MLPNHDQYKHHYLGIAGVIVLGILSILGSGGGGGGGNGGGTPPSYDLTVSNTGTDIGTVTSSPIGIDCGSDCSENYQSNTVVTLTATPAVGSLFSGWSGACTGTGSCVITMDAAKSVTATFVTPPVITLLGDNPQTIFVGNPYTELGATATDDVDGDISSSLVIDSSDVDTSTEGDYIVTYDVTDSAGNRATTITRSVLVRAPPDTTAPEITLLGDNPQTITACEPYTELGAKALDDVDGDISGLIVIDSSTVDTSTAGIYTVTYDVTDSSGNAAAVVTRTVAVESLSPSSPSVAILVDPSIETAIQDELSVFISDLSKDGYSAEIHSVTESSPPQLRSYLQCLYSDSVSDLVGAILIGSVPTPRYYIFYPADGGRPQRGPWTGASYQYYEDLDGDFQILDVSQWLYDDHTGDVESEIWISVLPPLVSNAETISAIQRYFLKNHRYRLGLERPAAGYLNPIIGTQLETEELYNNRVNYVLGLIPDSYQWSWGPLTSRGNILVAPNNLLNDPVNFPGSDEVFYQEVQTGDYDILVSSAHGSAYGIGSNGYWYDRSYLNNNSIDVTFWFEGGCSTVDLDVIPSFGVTALYSESSKILAYRGATMPQGGLGGSSKGYYRIVVGTELSNGKSIGEAILEHRSAPLLENYASQREYFTAQHILLGDGTLRLQEYQ